jgi:hypothetical protein
MDEQGQGADGHASQAPTEGAAAQERGDEPQQSEKQAQSRDGDAEDRHKEDQQSDHPEHQRGHAQADQRRTRFGDRRHDFLHASPDLVGAGTILNVLE